MWYDEWRYKMEIFGWLLLIWTIGVFPIVGVVIGILLLLWEAIFKKI